VKKGFSRVEYQLETEEAVKREPIKPALRQRAILSTNLKTSVAEDKFFIFHLSLRGQILKHLFYKFL